MQLRLDPERSLPLIAHGPPDQSAGGSPVNSRRPRDRDHSLDTSKVNEVTELERYISSLFHTQFITLNDKTIFNVQ